MSSEIDNDIQPTTAPTPRIRINDGTASPSKRRSLYANNPAELKKKWQEQLNERVNQVQMTAEYGQALLQQKEKIEQRIRELEETQDDVMISPELQDKLAQLEKEAMSLDADPRKVVLTAAAAASSGNNSTSFMDSPLASAVDNIVPTESPQATSRAQSRRNRNSNRNKDVEFAAEIGNSLLKQVRQLQTLLQEKEEKIKEFENEKMEFERMIEMLNKQLRSREENEDSLKTQMWELEVKVQNLDQEKETQTIEVHKLRKEIQLQEKKLGDSTDLLEQVKAKEAKISNELSDTKSKYERQARAHKKTYNDLKKENQLITKHLDEAKQDNVNLKAKIKRKDEMSSPNTSKGLLSAIGIGNSQPPHSSGDEEDQNAGSSDPYINKIMTTLNHVEPQMAEAVKQLYDELKVSQAKNGSLQSESEELRGLLADREEEIVHLRNEPGFPVPRFKPKRGIPHKKSSSLSQDITKDAMLDNSEGSQIGDDEDEQEEETHSDYDIDNQRFSKSNRPTSDMFRHHLRPRVSRASSHLGQVVSSGDEYVDENGEVVLDEQQRSRPISLESQDPEDVKAARAQTLEHLTKSPLRPKSTSSKNSIPLVEDPEAIQDIEDEENASKPIRGSVIRERVSLYEGIAKKRGTTGSSTTGGKDEQYDEYETSSGEDFASATSQIIAKGRDSAVVKRKSLSSSIPNADATSTEQPDQEDFTNSRVAAKRNAYLLQRETREASIQTDLVGQHSVKPLGTEAGVQTDPLSNLPSLEDLKETASVGGQNPDKNRFTLDLTAKSVPPNINNSRYSGSSLTERPQGPRDPNLQRSRERLTEPPPRPLNGPPQSLVQQNQQQRKLPIPSARQQEKGKQRETTSRNEPSHQHTPSSGSVSSGSTVSSSSSIGKNNSNTSQADEGQSSIIGPRLDPSTVQAITQTMMGEYLYKYTRRNFGGGISEKRHQRFFWVHPYTRTLYWSTKDPGGSDMTDAKSSKNSMLSMQVAYIESVREVDDSNPSPPKLYNKSLVVVTPGRDIKFTAPSKECHDVWYRALSYLVERVAEPEQPSVPRQTQRMGSDPWDNQPDSRHLQQTSGSSPNDTLNTRPVPQELKKKSSFSKIQALIRPSSSSANIPSPLAQGHYQTHSHGDAEFDPDDDDFENVRECCDGRHNVNDLAGKRGRRN